MASIYDNPALQEARTAAQTATQTAASESAAGISLPDQLRSALNAKFSTANPIYADREAGLKDYLNATTQAPLNVTHTSAGGTSDVVYNPAQQANLIQQYRSPSIARLQTLNDLLGLATGGMENVIGATSRAHQGEVAGLNAKAQNANQNYRDLFGELSARAEEAYKAQQLQLEREKIAKSGSGGDKLSDLLRIYSLMKPTASQSQAGINAKSALEALNMARDIVGKDSSSLFLSQLPFGAFNPNAQKLKGAMNEMTDVFARLRSGAVLNPSEIKLYDQNKPQPGDTAEALATKFTRLEKIYNDVIARSDVPDVMTFLRQQTGGDTGGSTSKGSVTMINPDGQLFTVDASEVEEAKRNGWRVR